MLAYYLLQTKNQSTSKTTEVRNATNSNENRTKTCCDHDITMANTMNNNKLPLELFVWSDRQDCRLYSNRKLVPNCIVRPEIFIGHLEIRKRCDSAIQIINIYNKI